MPYEFAKASKNAKLIAYVDKAVTKAVNALTFADGTTDEAKAAATEAAE